MRRVLLIFLLTLSASSFASQWNQRQSIPASGRHRSTAEGLGNFGYVGLGHYNGVGFEVYFNDWWQFNPASNSWTQKSNYPGNNGLGELGCHSWTYDDKVYVGLGENVHEELYRFDPETNSWEQMTSAPFGILFQDTHDMEVSGGAYFIDMFTADLYYYDYSSDSWSNAGTAPIPLNFTYSAYTYDDNVWVKADMTMYMYEPSSGLWYQVVSAGTFPGYATRGSADFFLDGYFYVVGGYGSDFGDVTAEVWQFDPVNYEWQQMQDFPGTARRFSRGMVIDGKAYIVTGTNGTNLNDLWEFNPTLGVIEPSEFLFEIGPNPTSDILKISGNIQNFSVRLSDMSGKIIYTNETTNGYMEIPEQSLKGMTTCGIYQDGILLRTERIIYL